MTFGQTPIEDYSVRPTENRSLSGVSRLQAESWTLLGMPAPGGGTGDTQLTVNRNLPQDPLSRYLALCGQEGGEGQQDVAFVQKGQENPVQSAQANLERVIARHGANSIEAVSARRLLAVAHIGAGNLDQAARETQTTLDVLRNLPNFGPNHPQYAFSLGIMADIRTRQGRHTDARTSLTEAERILSNPAHRDDPIAQAGLELVRGQMAVNREHIRVQEAVAQHGPNSIEAGRARRGLGVALLRDGDLAGAARELSQAVEIMRARLGANDPEVGFGMATLGVVRQHQNQLPQALQLCQGARDILRNNNANGQFDAHIRQMEERIRDLQRRIQQGQGGRLIEV